jgi:choline dehydrogenase-like flavoprotein
MISGDGPVRAYGLETACEQAPSPDNRVTLDDERDRFNRPKAVLHWGPSEVDLLSLRRTLEIIGRECGRSGIGRLWVHLDWDKLTSREISGSAHHIGTTRMHGDPRKGVVDANCKVHDVDNLFVAGSSVFPTSSSATPTFTLIALAVRLADHIKALPK